MQIYIIGLGYVGLTLAVHLSNCGLRVHGIDHSEQIHQSLSQGKAHFFEQGFDEQLLNAIQKNHFTFSKTLDMRSLEKSVFIITVGTPLISGQEAVNLEPLKTVCHMIKNYLKDGDLVMLRSTLRIGATRDITKPILDQSNKAYSLAYCPERTLTGHALKELATLPQIISGIDEPSLNKVQDFFTRLNIQTISLESVEEAEMVKLINNAERDVMFSFANEVALMCDAKGLNAHRIIKAANHEYPRSFLKKPGLVGGSCLTKDSHILTEGFLFDDYMPRLFKTARAINEDIVHITLGKTFNKLEKKLQHLPHKIAILGFAFKGAPATSDIRGSLVYSIISIIKNRYPHIQLIAHDYLVPDQDILASEVIYAQTVADAVNHADLVILQNNHTLYAQEDWLSLEKSFGKGAMILDFWHQLTEQPQKLTADYFSFGALEC